MLIILAISPEVIPLSYSFQKFSAPVNQCSSSPENCQEPKFNLALLEVPFSKLFV